MEKIDKLVEKCRAKGYSDNVIRFILIACNCKELHNKGITVEIALDKTLKWVERYNERKVINKLLTYAGIQGGIK